VDGGAEHVPLDRVLRLPEARGVAEHADGDVFNAPRVVQCDVHGEAVVAPVHVAAHAVLARQMLAQRCGEW
jgi:hypothetical protein